MGVSKNNGIPKSSIFIGFSIIFTIHFVFFPPFFGNSHIFVASFPSLFQVETTNNTTREPSSRFVKNSPGEELPLKVEKRAKGKKAMPRDTPKGWDDFRKVFQK